MDTTLPAHRVETILQQDGTLTLDHLPFRAGQGVEVIILLQARAGQPGNPYPLRGVPFHFERFTEPVAHDDWEVLQ